MTGTNVRRRLAVAVGGVVAAGLVAIGLPVEAAQAKTAAPANVAPASPEDKAARNGAGVSAAHLDSACNRLSNGTGDLCLWYFSNFGGSFSDFYFGDNNLNDNVFVAPGSGKGQRVGNNAESAVNFDLTLSARLWTGINFTGTALTIAPGSGRASLGAGFLNNVESFQWI